MTIKICFNNQTHRISKHPADFTALIQKVSEIFENQLPQNWTLQYLDSDEDKIMLNSHEDYKTLLEEEVGNSNKSVKIFVLPLEEGQSKVDLSAMLESQRKESVEIIDKPLAEEEVIEKVEVQEIKNEEIVQEKVAEPIIEQPIVEEQPQIEAVIEEEKPKVEEIEQEKKEEEAKPEVPIHPLHKIFVNFLRPREEVIADKKEKIQAKTAEKLKKIQEKKQKFLQLAAEKQAKKKNELRDAVTDIIYEQLPIIASLTKEFIQDNNISTEPRKRQVPQSESLTVHRTVKCDGCGVFPIVGIRYKCYTCPNFDYCEKCEVAKEHPHPFIKFKKPQERERGHCPMNRGPFFGRVHPHPHFHQRPQPQPEMRDFPFGPFGFIRCMKKMNEELNTQQQQAQPQPEVQKAEANKPQETEPILIKAEVVIEEVKPEEIIKEKKEEEIVKEEKKEYDAKTLEKAERLKEVFGDLDMEHVLEFISQVSDLSLEDLIGSYQGF